MRKLALFKFKVIKRKAYILIEFFLRSNSLIISVDKITQRIVYDDLK